ncbi:MAG TPA: tetratricopeptide repeat protein [Candidatus Marinimicrobia bacterium]|nr:tetratricopeptide repeat protein [Candidatus Neomarinimicrobiota bacterium]HRS52309.1 tetratricopeptide repeat protein [Candidatus Neomarinimicrobiota bacterium]HRU92047.1 tetratricopeptide repeat protein [Candidatus Neomarinimicrobiota bacterium]
MTATLSAQWYFKIVDAIHGPIEYRTPLKLTLFEIKTGLQSFGFDGQPLLFDTTGISFDGYQTTWERSMNSFELDLMKFNWLVYIVPQNLLDFQTGIGAKYAYSLSEQKLPATWPQRMPGGRDQLFLSPRIYEFNLNQTIIYQWAPNFYNYLTVSYGQAFGSAYKTHSNDYFLHQKGNTYSFALGFKFLGSVGYKLKEGYGIEIRYTTSDFGDLDDPHKISPIKKINFNSVGISLAFNSNLGGGRSLGDDAQALYQAYDFIAAKATFEQFIADNPHHPSRFKARRMIKECDQRIPHQEAFLAEFSIFRHNYPKAAEHLARAQVTKDTTLLARINRNYQRMITQFADSMNAMITNNRIDDAEQLLNEIEMLDIPNSDDLLHRYRSEIYFHRGAVFTEYGYWEKAIEYFDRAIQYYPPIRNRVEPYLIQIADGYINDANLSVDKKSIALALESLSQATALRPDIHYLTAPHIQSIEAGIEYLKQQDAKQKVQESISKTFNPPPETPKPEIGMNSNQIKSLLGQPGSQTRLEASGGRIYELWIYLYPDGNELQIYFDNEKVVKMETLSPVDIISEMDE